MNLDKIQVNACLRSGWQAVDLGFLMARAWWKPLFLACAVPVLILFVPLAILMPTHPLWIAFTVWWLKPFWERLPLYLASRKLFDDDPSFPEIRARARRLFLFDAFPFLLWRRFSVQRAFNAPVSVLEELKGANRRKRLQVLHGRYSDVAFATQLVCFCFELILGFGLVVMLAFFTPDFLAPRVYDSFDELTLAGGWIYCVAACIAMILVMPFHTMGGFALYLNRRIELEAWDIEISFRNLASRKRRSASGLAGAAVTLVLVGLLALGAPSRGEAATRHDRESAAALINQVLQGPDFGTEKTVRKWRFKDWGDEDEDSVPEWLIEFIEWWEENVDIDDIPSAAGLLKFLLIAGFILLVLFLLRRYQGPLSGLVRRRFEEAPPEVLFGLDVTPESLPTDVPTEVRTLWGEGQYREAIGLLYRASLSRLIDRHELAFRASHTEAECAALVAQQGIESVSRFFDDLTQVWRRLAYGHQLPPAEKIEALCVDWSREMSDEPV